MLMDTSQQSSFKLLPLKAELKNFFIHYATTITIKGNLTSPYGVVCGKIRLSWRLATCVAMRQQCSYVLVQSHDQ
jgi:hypothetical protein